MGDTRGIWQSFSHIRNSYEEVGGIFSRLKLAPVQVRHSLYDQRRLQPEFRETLWMCIRSWVYYYAIQWRWDIERAIARLLHQRWV